MPNYASIMIFLCLNLFLCQVRPLGSCWVIVNLILLKNRNLCAQKNNFHKSQKRAFALNFLHKIDIKISHSILGFQNFWSYRSILSSLITTYCFVFWQILFSLRCVLVLMILWFSLTSFCHRKVWMRYIMQK